MIIGLHHITIPLPLNSEQRARDFYCHLLGFTEVPPPAENQTGGIWLKLGELYVHLQNSSQTHIENNSSLCLMVDDLEILKFKLAAGKFLVQDLEPLPGKVRFKTQDPFLNNLEFIQLI